MTVSSSRSAERRYGAMLRKGKKGAAAPASASAAAATKAIDGIVDIRRRVNRGDYVDEEDITAVSAATGAVQIDPSVRAAMEKAAKKSGFPTAAVVLAGLGVALLLVGYSVVSAVFATYDVAGGVYLNRSQLPNAEVTFHPTAGGDPIKVTTGAVGDFQVAGMKPGEYAVTISGGGAAIPPEYTAAETTPFKLQVDRDMDNLQFYAASKRPR